MLSFQDEIWQIPWEEQDVIAAIKQEMRDSCSPYQEGKCQTRLTTRGSGWQSQGQAQATSQGQIGTHTPLQLPKYQTAAFVMTRIQGTPALVFTAFECSQPQAAEAETVEKTTPQKKQSQVKRTLDSSPPDASPERVHTPLVTLENFDGEFPSVGSEGHFDGSCKRCAFFPKGRCKNGKDCAHCHFPHERRARLRKRGAAKGHKEEDEVMSEAEPAETGMSEESCLAEVLAYLSEPAESASRKSTVSSFEDQSKYQSDLYAETQIFAATADRDEIAEAAVEKFNTALREASKAYMTNGTDSDTTPSVSALSDGEENVSTLFGDSEVSAAGTTKTGAPSDISDSEIASMQETVRQKEVLSDSEPLMRSAKSWSAIQRERKAESGDIGRMARSLLNKLTEGRFESLCSQLLSLPLSTPEQLAVVVAEIFQKATTQNSFRFLYTELCMRLDAHLTPQTSSIGGKAFRKALVNECQATFERSLLPPDVSCFEGLEGDARYEAEVKVKTRVLGNMRFIGDLLVRRLLAPKLLPPIVHELLHGTEAAIESLIALLSIVGPEFELKPSLYQAPLRDAFAVLGNKMSEKSLCPRLCCQINDLLDAKARGWQSLSTTA
jgi:hypothetical protein